MECVQRRVRRKEFYVAIIMIDFGAGANAGLAIYSDVTSLNGTSKKDMEVRFNLILHAKMAGGSLTIVVMHRCAKQA